MKLLWLSAISCNGNAHSFLNYEELERFLEDFEFIYHPILKSKYTLKEIAQKEIKCDILLIEGAITSQLKRGEVAVDKIIKRYAKQVKKIVTVGTCATFGGIFKHSLYSDATGLLFNKEEENRFFTYLKNKVISISGCPIHPENLATVLYSIKYNKDLKLDEFNRPNEFFGYTIHNGCNRNEYFEYKIDNHTFGKKEGCMYYDNGCKAPYTRGNCNNILWNEVNTKTKNGEPCHGCTDPNFPEYNFFTTKKNMGVPAKLPLGVSKRAYITHAGIMKTFKIKRFFEDLF